LNGNDTDLNASGTVRVPAGFTASVTETQQAAFGPAGAQPPNTDVLRIAVTVTYKGDSVTLEGYRTKYAPNDMP
jgi:MSHA pilin protein MshD